MGMDRTKRIIDRLYQEELLEKDLGECQTSALNPNSITISEYNMFSIQDYNRHTQNPRMSENYSSFQAVLKNT